MYLLSGSKYIQARENIPVHRISACLDIRSVSDLTSDWLSGCYMTGKEEFSLLEFLHNCSRKVVYEVQLNCMNYVSCFDSSLNILTARRL